MSNAILASQVMENGYVHSSSGLTLVVEHLGV